MTGGPAFPFIKFALSVGTWDLQEFAYLDTGLEGGLLISEGMGREILAAYTFEPMKMPDGAIIHARTWSGELDIQGHPVPDGLVCEPHRRGDRADA